MNRFIKGMSYAFGRNLGWQDRLVRAALSLGVLTAYFLGIISGPVGIILAIIAGMLLVTAVIARCSICYIAGICTIKANERARLDDKGIPYED